MRPHLLLQGGATATGPTRNPTDSLPFGHVATVAGPPILDSFISYSIEFIHFPDFAGPSRAKPNHFSANLLRNIEDIQGAKPIIRVGGPTQDYAIYNASLTDQAWTGIVDPNVTDLYPTKNVQFGPKWLEAYGGLHGHRFIHGFNMALSGGTHEGWQAFHESIGPICKAVGQDGYHLWEYGNEPDVYTDSRVRPLYSLFLDERFIREWINGTAYIDKWVKWHCPDIAANPDGGFVAGGFANHGYGARLLNETSVWWLGLNTRGNIKEYSSHHYTADPGEGKFLKLTFLKHFKTMEAIQSYTDRFLAMFPERQTNISHIFGEMNLVSGGGQPGVTDSFGGALAMLDLSLYAASQGIQRIHTHLLTDSKSSAWQPINTTRASQETKPFYYANLATAAMLSTRMPYLDPGDPRKRISVGHYDLPATDYREAAYGVYRVEDDADLAPRLARIMLINLAPHNTTRFGLGAEPLADNEQKDRGSRNYTLEIRDESSEQDMFYDGFPMPGYAVAQRLLANGTDARSGITWDGRSYARELRNGMPRRLANMSTTITDEAADRTGAERILVVNGTVTVNVPDGSAVMLTFFNNQDEEHLWRWGPDAEGEQYKLPKFPPEPEPESPPEEHREPPEVKPFEWD